VAAAVTAAVASATGIRAKCVRTHRSTSARYLSTNKWLLFLPSAQGCSRSALPRVYTARKSNAPFRSSFTRLSFFFRDNGHSEAWKVHWSRQDEPQRKYFSTFLRERSLKLSCRQRTVKTSPSKYREISRLCNLAD